LGTSACLGDGTAEIGRIGACFAGFCFPPPRTQPTLRSCNPYASVFPRAQLSEPLQESGEVAAFVSRFMGSVRERLRPRDETQQPPSSPVRLAGNHSLPAKLSDSRRPGVVVDDPLRPPQARDGTSAREGPVASGARGPGD